MADELIDPCPGAARVGGSHGWQHPTAVRCQACGYVMRYAWWNGREHLCGRCRWPRDDS